MWMLRWLLLPAYATFACTAGGAEVFRCGQDVVSRYQDVPCAVSEPERRWTPLPVQGMTSRYAPAPAVPRRARRAARKGRPAQAPAAALITLQRDPEGCRKMQELRGKALLRERRRPDYLLQRGWDDRVREACR